MAMRKRTTEEACDGVLRLIASGLSMRKACRLTGISQQGFLRRCDEDAELGQRYQMSRDRAEADMLKVIMGAAHSNWTAAAWYLERCHPRRYSRAAGERAVRRMDNDSADYDPAMDGEIPEG